MNPFEQITPRAEELMINEGFLKELSKKIKEQIKNKRIIIIQGDYGTGKSLYLNRLYDRLNTKKDLIPFNEMITNVLVNKVPVKNKSLFIDDFDLIKGLSDDGVFDLAESMINLIKQEMIIVIACRKESIKRLFYINPLIQSKSQKIRVPRLNYTQATELILKRLNETRRKPTDDLDPFTKQEIKIVLQKADGNPRLLMLLLKPLYEQRMNLKDLT